MSLTKKEKELIYALETKGPCTEDELAIILECSTKRIRNIIGILKRSGQEIVHVFDEDLNKFYLLPEFNKFDLELKPKLFSYKQSKNTPYLIINVPEPKGDSFKIVPYGDIQFGLNTVRYELVDKLFKYIEDNDDVYCVDGGDILDNANKNSPGASVFEQKYNPLESLKIVTEKQSKHAHKLFFKLRGNHEARSVNATFFDPSMIIADRIEVPHFPGQVLFDLVCGDKQWELYAYHGSANSSTTGSRLNNLMKKADWAPADIFLMFHVNDRSTAIDDRIIKNRKEMTLDFRERMFVLCGHATDYWYSYADEMGLKPMNAGFKVLEFFVKGPRAGTCEVQKLFLG